MVGSAAAVAWGAAAAGAAAMNPDDMARMRDAMRDITSPSDHLIITQTESMVVLTGADGRTTRLSPDGKKIKDENTKIERKTKWDGGKLVSEINGLGPGKMTQTFAVDPESKQLRMTVVMEGGALRPAAHHHAGLRRRPAMMTSGHDALGPVTRPRRRPCR